MIISIYRSIYSCIESNRIVSYRIIFWGIGKYQWESISNRIVKNHPIYTPTHKNVFGTAQNSGSNSQRYSKHSFDRAPREDKVAENSVKSLSSHICFYSKKHGHIIAECKALKKKNSVPKPGRFIDDILATIRKAGVVSFSSWRVKNSGSFHDGLICIFGWKNKILISDELYFVTYTIIRSIISSEMCSLHLTHPSAHTLGAVGSRHYGARGTVGGLVPCLRVSPQSWTIPARAEIRTHKLGLQVRRSIH